MNTVKESTFVKPYFIEQLGGFGVTAADIGKSLNVPPSTIREKLIRNDFYTRLKTQGFQTIAFARVTTNNLEFTEYALDTNAAKFFVGKWSSALGDGYLAFLIHLEQNIDDYKKLCAEDEELWLIEQVRKRKVESIRLKKRQDELEGSVIELAQRVDQLEGDNEYLTVVAYAKRHNIKMPHAHAQSLGRRASKKCREQSIPIGKIKQGVYGEVNSYPEEILKISIKELIEIGKI